MIQHGLNQGMSNGRSISEYIWIADQLQTEIEKGRYSYGMKLPSESELCRRFKQNRYTIRQALDLLVHSGLIRAHQGKGHYVCEKPLHIQYTITPGMRFSKVMTELGCIPSAVLLQQEVCSPPERVRQGLRLANGEDVYRLEILRLADGIPLSWNETWLPVSLFPDLPDHTKPFHSLYDMQSAPNSSLTGKVVRIWCRSAPDSASLIRKSYNISGSRKYRQVVTFSQILV